MTDGALKWAALLFAGLSTGGSFIGSVMTESRHTGAMDTMLEALRSDLVRHDHASSERLDRFENSVQRMSERVSLLEHRVRTIEEAHQQRR